MTTKIEHDGTTLELKLTENDNYVEITYHDQDGLDICIEEFPIEKLYSAIDGLMTQRKEWRKTELFYIERDRKWILKTLNH